MEGFGRLSASERTVKIIFSIYIGLIILLSVAYTGNNLELHKIFILYFRADHLIHVALFLPWAFFGVRMKNNLLLWFCWGILFATGTEGLQYLLPYRSFNISDMIANMIGVVLGFGMGIREGWRS